MKLTFLSLLTALLLTGGLPPRQRQPRPNQTPSAPVRRALLVGAWDYPPTPDGDFPSLKSEGRTAGPVEDVKALKSVLVKRLQFKDEERLSQSVVAAG